MIMGVSITDEGHFYGGEVTVPGDDKIAALGVNPGEPLELVEWAEEVLQALLDGTVKLVKADPS